MGKLVMELTYLLNLILRLVILLMNFCKPNISLRNWLKMDCSSLRLKQYVMNILQCKFFIAISKENIFGNYLIVKHAYTFLPMNTNLLSVTLFLINWILRSSNLSLISKCMKQFLTILKMKTVAWITELDKI